MRAVRRPIKILYVVSGDLWAGAEAQVAALVDRLALDPDISLRAVVLNRGELAKRIELAGVPVTVLDESRLSSIAILGGIRRVIRGYDPHVVHTHRSKENVLGSMAAHLEGRRASLRTVHGASEHGVSWWRLDKQLYRALDRWAARHWQRVAVAVSEDLGRVLTADLPGAKICVIHNGLDEASFEPLRKRRASRPLAGEVRIAFVGRLVPIKRVDLLLGAMALIQERDDPRWSLEIVGDGPLRAGLESQSAQLGLEERVHFRGFRPDAIEILADCDLLIFTSDHEGTPMAALEAMAVGVPVLGRRVGGLVELLDGVPGCGLVESDSPRAVADAIRNFIPNVRDATIRLPDRYRMERCAEQYVGLYRSLVERS